MPRESWSQATMTGGYEPARPERGRYLQKLVGDRNQRYCPFALPECCLLIETRPNETERAALA